MQSIQLPRTAKRGRGRRVTQLRRLLLLCCGVVRTTASAAGVHAGLKRGRQDETASPGTRRASGGPLPQQDDPAWPRPAGGPHSAPRTAASTAGVRAGRTEGTAGPTGGPLPRIHKQEKQHDTKTLTSDVERKIEPRKLAPHCQHDVLEWVRSKAADTSFQPTGEKDLVAAACSHLLHAIPEVQTNNSYADPGRLFKPLSQVVIKPELLWQQQFQGIRNGGPLVVKSLVSFAGRLADMSKLEGPDWMVG